MMTINGEPNANEGWKCGQSVNPHELRLKTECVNDGRGNEYEQKNSVADSTKGIKNEKNFIIDITSDLDRKSERTLGLNVIQSCEECRGV